MLFSHILAKDFTLPRRLVLTRFRTHNKYTLRLDYKTRGSTKSVRFIILRRLLAEEEWREKGKRW